jgi:hypothetical protein
MNSTSNDDTMDSAKEWYYWPIYPEYGKGYVTEKNPYKDGVTEYATTEHYRIFFPIKGVYVTVFLKHLMRAQAD